MLRIVFLALVSHFGLGLAAQQDWKQLDFSCNDGNVSLDALHKLSNKTVVTLSNCTYTLASPLTISAAQGLHIIGNDSVIDCTGDDAGLMFKMVSDLLLEKLTIRHCGMYLSQDKLQIASVKIMNGSNVTVRNVIIENGTGTGLSLVNVGGNVTVEDCTFRYNKYYINRMYRVTDARNKDFVQRGGGMHVITNDLSNSTYRIWRCNFTSNFAFSGGGLFIVIKHAARFISMTIKDSHFVENKCENGGGGVQFGYVVTEFWHPYQIMNNSILFQLCVFKGNEAGYGGGTAIFSSLGSREFSYNHIQLNNCTWSRNIAAGLGMAVDVAIAPWERFTKNSLDFPKPRFKFCNFTKHSHSSINSLVSIFTVTGFEIKFNRSILFEDNNGTAIEATSSVLNFKATTAKFINNRGINGGAIRLKGLSVIVVRDNSHFVFSGNSAVERGGAIYVDSSDRYSSSCFIENKKKYIKAFFNFLNNTAGYNKSSRFNNSIYASSILSCLDQCSHQTSTVSLKHTLKCIGKFEFNDLTNPSQQLTSAPTHFARVNTSNDQLCKLFVVNSMIHWNPHFRTRLQNVGYHLNNSLGQLDPVIPGRKAKIPLKLVDELCEEVFSHVSVAVLNGNISIKRTIITTFDISLYGKPYDSGVLQFSADGVHAVTLSVRLDDCPPGYLHNTDSCVCSLSTKLHYPGIERCNKTNFKAYAKLGYWLGYVKNQLALEKCLASSICPKGFCKSGYSEISLPSVPVKDLSSHICTENRSGVICGSCKQNYSANYRSTKFSCKSNNICHLGWLFYIISEIFPVTVLFLIVIYFNISFTSGALNGVILFMQIVTTFKIEGENFIQFNETIRRFSRIYKVLYRIFELKFLAIEELSFCLWEGATALDMLAFRYVTIVYSLFLVIITVIMLRKCTCRFGKVKDLKIIKPSFNLKHSILNGLSAFLVMNYSECTQVTLMILTTGTLTVGPVDKNNYSSYEYKYVAFYNGNYEYMGPEHLKYALPAIVFLLTLVALPPILLIVYPLCYKLFALLKIDESKFVKIVCQVIPLEKIKPLFDSIQGEFKDQYRFFAGLYFIYRLTTSLTFTFTSALKTYYSATCVQLTVMLVLHAICCPYKKKRHNVLDALLIANLIIINIISFFNYVSGDKSNLATLAGLQCGLILLPLVYLVVYIIYNIVMKIKVKMFSSSFKENLQEVGDNSNDVLELLDARHLDTIEEVSSDYVPFQENNNNLKVL